MKVNISPELCAVAFLSRPPFLAELLQTCGGKFNLCSGKSFALLRHQCKLGLAKSKMENILNVVTLHYDEVSLGPSHDSLHDGIGPFFIGAVGQDPLPIDLTATIEDVFVRKTEI